MAEVDDRPVSVEEWPFEANDTHDSWVIGKPNPTVARKDWCKAQQKLDPNFEWCWHGSRKATNSPGSMVILGTGVQSKAPLAVHKVRIGSFFFFKREQDAMLFKLTWD